MKNLTIFEKLDLTLKYVLGSEDQNVFTYLNDNKDLMDEILDKLHKDGYIRRVPLSSKAANPLSRANLPTIEGRMFHGYVRQKEIDDQIITENAQTLGQIRSYQNRLLWGTWFAGFAAALVLGWYIFVWFCPHPADCFCVK